MANFIIEVKAPELVEALNNLASAFKGGAKVDVSGISDAEAAKSTTSVEDPERYSMFQNLKKVAQELQAMDKKEYEKVLYTFVPKGKKYSAVEPADWGPATKKMKAAIERLKAKAEEEEADDFDDEEEEEEVAAPKHTLAEIRAFAAKAKNKGVKVGPLIKEISGETKLSSIPKSKYDTFYKSLEDAVAEMED